MKRYYYPFKNIIDHFSEKYKNCNVLEVGPGPKPIPNATHLIDVKDWTDKFKTINIDINEDVIPFPDKFFDFTYCRHVLEDIYNPKFALKEIIRVSKAFYIETPSPMVELTRGILHSTSGEDIPLRGYTHHRYFISYNHISNEISFLPKFPLIENDKTFVCSDFKSNLENPVLWNTYMYIENQSPTIINYQHGVNFIINDDYSNLIIKMLEETYNSTFHFFNLMKIKFIDNVCYPNL